MSAVLTLYKCSAYGSRQPIPIPSVIDGSYKYYSTEMITHRQQYIRYAGGLSVTHPSPPTLSHLSPAARVGSPAKPARASSYSAEPNPYLTRQPHLLTTIIPRHRIPSNRIPTSKKWPQQSRRSTPKSGPTRSRTTSAPPVSRHPKKRRIHGCKRRRIARAHCYDLAPETVVLNS